MIIKVDTREKQPYEFTSFPEVETVKWKLDFGDYTLEGFEKDICVERKSLDDFVNSICGDRFRFKERIKEISENIKYACVVVEGSMLDIIEKKYFGRMKPSSVLGSLLSIQLDYGIAVQLCENRVAAQAYALAFMSYAARKIEEEKERIKKAEMLLGVFPFGSSITEIIIENGETKNV